MMMKKIESINLSHSVTVCSETFSVNKYLSQKNLVVKMFLNMNSFPDLVFGDAKFISSKT